MFSCFSVSEERGSSGYISVRSDQEHQYGENDLTPPFEVQIATEELQDSGMSVPCIRTEKQLALELVTFSAGNNVPWKRLIYDPDASDSFRKMQVSQVVG